MANRGLEHHRRSVNVHVGVLGRSFEAGAHPSEGRKVNDRIGAMLGEDAAHPFGIADVGAQEKPSERNAVWRFSCFALSG
jgi:hypothetical protein